MTLFNKVLNVVATKGALATEKVVKSKTFRTLSLAILCFMTVSTLNGTIPVFADITTSGGSGSTPVVLDATPTNFVATVPVNLQVELLANGTVVCADSGTAVITNNSPLGGIKVTDVTVSGSNSWVLGSFGDNWAAKKVNSKQFGFKLNTETVDAGTGKVALGAANWPVITAGGGTLPLVYDAKFSAQATAIADQEIGTVVFVLGWDEV